MAAEIAGGVWTGSIALVADGLHTSTHAAVLTMGALAYRYARQHERDPRFAFGTGKIGDLAGFASAVVLAVIAMLILWEAMGRIVAPVPIGFSEAIGLAALGLVVNVLSVWLLRGGVSRDASPSGRPHPHLHRDNNMRAIVLHIVGDGAVSILVICGLLAARASGALWLDPAAGIASAAMVVWLAYVLLRDTGAILLDVSASTGVTDAIRQLVESGGDRVTDLHVWRIGPGRLGAVLTIVTDTLREAAYYRGPILSLAPIAQLTIEVRVREEAVLAQVCQ